VIIFSGSIALLRVQHSAYRKPSSSWSELKRWIGGRDARGIIRRLRELGGPSDAAAQQEKVARADITPDRLIPTADWSLATVQRIPTAYGMTISEAGGGYNQIALGPEVLHFRIGVDAIAPWYGSPPLRRAHLTAGMLHAIESGLTETYENTPLGSQIVPFAESSDADREAMSRNFRGKRGRIVLRESVQIHAAGGPAPAADWKPEDISPDLSKSMTKESLAAARESILSVFGVLPAMLEPTTTGPLIRESQRHLATWTLQPIANLLAEEATAKLGSDITIDVLQPMHSYDVGARSRSFATLIEGMAAAKTAGLAPEAVAFALKLMNWEE
jgi:phage portal protein BeeE